MDSIEDFVLAVKLIFAFLLFFLPPNWHPLFLPNWTLCYVKGQLPLTTSGGLDLANLNQMNWSMLPIDLLWPHILNEPAVKNMLLDHCGELSHKQILWISQFDPSNRHVLLTNDECMKKVDWTGLELDDYKKHLPELGIQSINDLNSISDEIIVHGLSKVNFSFSSLRVHCDFLERMPLRLLSCSQILKNPLALSLFNANCFMRADDLIGPFSEFLFKIQPSSCELIWRIQLAEFEDFLKTFPNKNNVKFLERCQDASKNLEPLPQNLQFSPSYNVIMALQNRNFDFISSLDPQRIESYLDLGPFDQYRLILIILGRRNLDIFIKYFEADLFDNWVILKVLQDKAEIADWLYTADIPSLPLLRILSLNPLEALVSTPPILVRRPSEIKNVQQLRGIMSLIATKRFSSRNFRIKFDDDAVVDLGGPLMDWITRILHYFLEFGLFALPINFESEAKAFLDPQFFELLGLLHGKLVQIGSGPCWLPVIRFEILRNISSLLALKNDPEEAVRLFNDFQFPSLNHPNTSFHKIENISEIPIYLAKLEKRLESWKILAWEHYFQGLRYFFMAKVPRQFILKLLTPTESPTVALLLAHSQVVENQAVPHNLPKLWQQILQSFSVTDLANFLLFVTGQCRPVPISIFFYPSVASKLPQARTCFKHLFLYCPETMTDSQALAAWLSKSLKTSIDNYEGFGNI